MNVGEYIKQLRTEKGLTQEELGDLLGVKRAAVNKWESGMVQNLKRTTIKRLADIFHVNPASFIDGLTPDEQITSGNYSEKEQTLIAQYRTLDLIGQGKVDEYISDLVDSGKYTTVKLSIAAKGGHETVAANKKELESAMEEAFAEQRNQIIKK